MRYRWIVRAVGLSWCAYGAVARAQDTSADIARRAMLAEADRARDAGDHARALDLAVRAGRIRMTPSLRLLLAQEHAALSQPLEALDAAGRCVHEAETDPAIANRERIVANCRALVTSLRARVGQVIVRAPSSAPADLRVRVQDAELAAPLLGVAYPVAPGAVVVEASSARGAFRAEVRVDAGATREVVVELTPVVVSTAPIAPPTRAPATRGGPGAAPWIVVGAGAAALGASVVFYALHQGAVADRDAACDATGCDPSARDANDAAATWRTLNNAALGVGAAAVAGGVLWWLLARSRHDHPPRAAWNVGPTSAGGVLLTVEGSL